MGAIGEAFIAFAQPLLDQTDGSEEQLNKALAISQLCYNLALAPEESQREMLSEIRPSLSMDDAQFDDFLQSIVIPMIVRHEEMFPYLHQHGSPDSSRSDRSSRPRPGTAAAAEAYPGTDRYAPCPCNSGRKYKFCCGKKRR